MRAIDPNMAAAGASSRASSSFQDEMKRWAINLESHDSSPSPAEIRRPIMITTFIGSSHYSEEHLTMPRFDTRTHTLLPRLFQKYSSTHGLSRGHHHPEYATTSSNMNMMMPTATCGTGNGGVHAARVTEAQQRLVTPAGSGTSTGGHSLGNLLAADSGGGPDHLESHGSSHISRCPSHIVDIYGTTATGGGEANLEAGEEQADGGAAPAHQQPSVNEKEEDKTLRHLFIQTYATLLPASAMAYPVLKDAPKYVKLIIFVGLLVIMAIVVFAGILSQSLARRRLALRLVSYSTVGLLTLSVASQLS